MNTKDGRPHPEYIGNQFHGNNFDLKQTNQSEVFSILSKLCKSKATGLDKISARILRICPGLISDSLCAIFNRSIVTGAFPNEWKCAKVIPLFKQGKRTTMDNQWTDIPVAEKVFERIIYQHVYTFLVVNNILPNCQSEFRGLHSTVPALLEATNSWAYSIDCGNVNSVVFLDPPKAFDTVDHGILLSKLHAYGIEGTVGLWFISYLSNRTQTCSVNGRIPDGRQLNCGIPPGTILGPLLLLIYINDPPNCRLLSQTH